MKRQAIKLYLAFFSLNVTFSSLAQQANNWYFGYNAGLTFNTSPPSPLLNGALYTEEGCASISDSAGNLLFYTDGIKVYNKLHQVMPNGTGLMGHASSSNSAIIIKQPGGNDLYYIFTADGVENSLDNGYRYSIVDINADNGSGDVIIKNTLLYAKCTERLTATIHANGIDVWVITKEWANDTFRVYRLGCNGLDLVPVVSNTGRPYYNSPTYNDAVGCIKVSPDGKKIAAPRGVSSGWEIFDFNNITGTISNSLFIPLNKDRIYGVEFSPDSKLVYFSTECCSWANAGTIHQFKIDVYDSATIANSIYLVDSSLHYKTALQLGPDGKIYSAQNSDSALNVINNPDQYGPGCGYVYRAINLHRITRRGLPAFPNSVLNNKYVDFSYAVSAGCSTVDFTATTLFPGPVTWSWNFGDGTYGSGQTISHIFPPASNSFNVTLTVTNISVCGATGTKMKNLTFNRLLPVAKFGFTTACGNTTVNFHDSTIVTGGSVAVWNWDFGDGQISNAQHPVHNYLSFGQYTVRLIATANDGCQTQDTTYKDVVIGPNPVSSFSFDKGCINSPVQFTDQSTIAINSIAQWHWDFGDGQTSVLQNPQHTYSSVGNYFVALVTYSNGDCASDTFTLAVRITNKPVADFNFNNSCAGTTVNFIDNSTLSAATITGWYWNFGNNNTSVSQNANTVYNLPGSYPVQHAVLSESNCPSDTIIGIITIEDKPVSKFGVITNCGNLLVQFKDSSIATAGSITTWHWDFGDGGTSTLQNPQHAYANFGNYTVKLTSATQYSCTADTIYKTITVPAKPVVNFNLPAVCLLDANADFINTTSISDNSSLSYAWNFGDFNASPPGSDVSNQVNPLYQYSAAAVYNVKLIALSSFGCADSITRAFTVNGAVPKADFRIFNPNYLCSNADITIKDSSTVDFGNITRLRIYWGDGDSTIENSPLQAPNGRTYNHRYPYFGTPATQTYTITVYSYSGTVCVDVITKNITLLASPQIQFNPIPETCQETLPLNVTQASELWGVAGTGTYSGNGIINSSTGNFSPQIAGTGDHAITYTFITTQGCRADSSQTIHVNPTPVSTFNFNAACLPNATLQFNSLSSVNGYTINQLTHNWTFDDPNASSGNPNTSTAVNPVHTFSSLDTFRIRLTVTSPKGCIKDTIIRVIPNINIFLQPLADFKPDSSKLFCQGTATTFINTSDSAGSSLRKWWWNFGDGATDSINRKPSHLYSTAGTFPVTLQVQNANGCKSVAQTKQVIIESIPVADFYFDTICLGKPIQFEDRSTNNYGSIVNWQWNFDDGNSSAIQNPVHTYTNYNTYRVRLTVNTGNGCPSSPIIKNIAINRVNIFAGRDTMAAAGQLVQLHAVGAQTYLWTPFTGLNNPNINNPVATIQNAQTYIVKGITSGGCIGYDTIKVVIFAKADIYVPTAFTPNGDGKNDLFIPIYVGIKDIAYFTIYNRWGETVFTTKNMGSGWDGIFRSKSQSTNVFTWVVKGKAYDGRVIERKGTVTLIR